MDDETVNISNSEKPKLLYQDYLKLLKIGPQKNHRSLKFNLQDLVRLYPHKLFLLKDSQRKMYDNALAYLVRYQK